MASPIAGDTYRLSLSEKGDSLMQSQRVLIVAAVVTIVFIGLVLVIAVVFRPAAGTAGIAGETGEVRTVAQRTNVLVNSTNACVACHRTATPGIVQQYGVSTMAAADVMCEACHVVAQDYPGAIEHEGTWVINSPTPAMCDDCHAAEVAQYNQSRHGIAAYVAVAGAQDLAPEHLALYTAVPEAQANPDLSRNIIAAMEGEDLTRFTCYGCHNIGRPHEDGTAGECQMCHLRHEFSLEQARKPETCNFCHIGPDHPQYEIYEESPHGIAYHTGGERWNWEAEPGTLTVEDFPAPTCAICHMSGFGTTGTTHDVGDRLTWFLFPAISQRRPGYQDNLVRMQGVCLECHNPNFVNDFYSAADAAVERTNELTQEGQDIVAQLREAGALTPEQFDEPIEYTIFELWHHWGRTTKFGVWMQGPDYSQWHGAYELLSDLAELREYAAEHLEAAVDDSGG